MPADDEIILLWKQIEGKEKADGAAIKFYRAAEAEGRKSGISEMESVLSDESTIQSAIQTFFGRQRSAKISKISIITTKAVVREIIYIANEKMKGGKA